MGFVCMLAVSVVVAGCCCGSPAVRRFGAADEATTSSDPQSGVTGGEWDEFDLDGSSDWMKDIAVSPSSIPLPSSDYEDYIDDDEDEDEETDDVSKMDVVSRINDDVVHQDSEEEDDDDEEDAEDEQHPSEFMFVPESNDRLLLQDDDGEQGDTIKVRHTGKNTYSEPTADIENSKRAEDQFDFTIDEDEEPIVSDNSKDNNHLDNSDDKDNNLVVDNGDNIFKSNVAENDDGDDDDDDDNDDNSIDTDDDAMFQQDDSQAMYGDHMFLY